MDKHMKPREAAKALGVSLHFVYESLWAGKLVGKRTAKGWLIPAEAVDARKKERDKCLTA